jgi:UDP-N-acetylglucosamine 2-epimerase
LNTGNTPTKKIFVITYGGGHVNMVIPILRHLETIPEYKIEVLGLTTAGPVLEKEGIPCFGFRHFIEDQDTEALEWGKRLAQGMQEGKVPQEETLAYLGLSYMDLIQRHGENKADKLYTELGRQAFCPLTVLERILKKVQPDLVITTNSPRAEKAAILSARKFNIPSVCLVDLFGLWEVEWIKDPQYADKVCVLSECVKNIFVNAGRNPDDIVITGNPAFDRLAQQSLKKKSRELRIQKNWEDSKVILWCSQPEPQVHPLTGNPGDPELPRKIENILIDLLPRHPQWRLVFRPHPNDNVQFHNLPERVEVSSSKDDLEVLLHAIDCIVTMTSTVGLQGAMLGKPFLAIEMSVFTPDAPYSDMGIAYGVDKLMDIEKALINILDKNWRPEIPPPISDGRATNNVIRVIQAML